ncbi:MAG TPA: transglycosylase family protein, partial [Candidatus Limnocylindrales bacterium]|nr:transglycosylase family protein [Candidatus Limnocylindrales bacterium]
MLSGRLKAVLVASLATIILIGASGMATTAATDPSGLAAFMRAVARVESGGSYTAQNGSSGAYGKYQIMPSSWQAWAAAYLGNGAAKPTPANQEIVAAAKFRALHRWLGNWRRVAYWWLTGSSQTSGWSAAASRYVTKVMVYYSTAPVTRVVTPTPIPVPVKAKVPPPATVTVTAVPLQRYAETAGTIVYRGAWTLASHTSYAGRAVKYAT